MSARSLNKVMLIGNLTRDPELRYTPNGAAVCSFRVATNRSWSPADGGERKEETEYHRIVTWNKLAELCSQLLSKGRKVYVEGRLQTRSWETPEGEKRYSTEVVAEDMVILDSRRDADSKIGEESQDVPEVKSLKVKPSSQDQAEGKKDKEVEKDSKEKDKKEDSSKTDQGDKEDKKSKKEDEEDKNEIDVDDIPF